MLVEFITKKHVTTEEKVEVELPILEKVAYLHYKYSGGYNYYVKFSPSMCETHLGHKIYKLDFIYMSDDKIIKNKIQISPLDFFPSLKFDEKRKEFDYIGQIKPLSHDYLSILANYWLLQKRVDDCFFTVITEEKFNEAKEYFFNK